MQRPGPASPPDGGSVPRELAARLMESHFPYTVTDEKPLIFAGSVPKEVPSPVPIPEDFVLVGSAQFASRGDRRVVTGVGERLSRAQPSARRLPPRARLLCG